MWYSSHLGNFQSITSISCEGDLVSVAAFVHQAGNAAKGKSISRTIFFQQSLFWVWKFPNLQMQLLILEEGVKPWFSLNQCTQVLQRETDSYSSRAANQWGKSHREKLKCSPEPLRCMDSINTMVLSGTISNRIVLCIKATISRHIWVKLEIQMSLNVVDTFAVLCIIEEDVKPRFSLNQSTPLKKHTFMNASV